MDIDTMKFQILPDGTIKVETDQVSEANHMNAESFLQFLAEIAGGETTRTRKTETHSHTHTHVTEGH